ncbi:tail fiber domain-containing protein [Bradyrhizobium jicamae]|uniref:tail fiber domain-containing protein n=1 Tax=Bradyrhizobium jicamae TaxID=280332 RepID=UPI001BA7580D|nr:tail fiber domain-containing protein [Bradyrhizobium jicamae]MBR0756607.1 tail fiber domain-containing protein [Bradyrhizobium jicamae]
MGGQSSSTQTQQSQTTPWTAAQPMLQGILSQLNTGLGNTGLTSAETGALNTLQSNAALGNPYAGQIGGYAQSLFGGGGANAQAGNVRDNLTTLRSQITPYANGSMIGNNPALAAQLAQIQADVGNSVNSQFAAAGRDLSGANQMAYGRGVAAAEAPVIAAQYNQDVNNQINAANALYNGGNTTANTLSGMQQNYLANQGQGVTAAQSALDAQNYGANATLAEEAQRRGIPVQALSLLAQIGVPIGQLGQQSNGTSNTTQEMSGADQFAKLAGGIGSILKFTPSDMRLKEDVAPVGQLFDGTPVYGYRYKGAPAYHIGLMAQDVERSAPHAVIEINGYKAVDYRAATEASRKIGEVG